MITFSDDGGLHELIEDVFEPLEAPLFIDLVEMLNKELVKYGLAIVRLTDTGDVDQWGIVPAPLLMSIFPNAKDPLEAVRYFDICVSIIAGWQIVLSDEERSAIRGRCGKVEWVLRAILPDIYAADP